MPTKSPTYGYGREPLTEAQKKLVEDNIGLCYSMMKRHSKIPYDQWDEMLAEVVLSGLISAARKFDPSRGKFSTLACIAIRQRLWNHWSRAKKYPEPIDMNDHRDTATAPDRPCAAPDAAMDAERLMGRLTEMERMVILLRFWDGLTLCQIGVLIGRTGENVRNIQDRAFAKMRAQIPKRPL